MPRRLQGTKQSQKLKTKLTIKTLKNAAFIGTVSNSDNVNTKN
jgi:hypothetical protein